MTGKGKILDFGCGAGTFLKVAKERGWEPSGVEVGSWAEEAARDLGFDLFIGRLEDAKYPNALFDVVFCSSVLEHLWNPLRELKEIIRKLSDIAGNLGELIANTKLIKPGPKKVKITDQIKKEVYELDKLLGSLQEREIL